jgi:hypothetical protein
MAQVFEFCGHVAGIALACIRDHTEVRALYFCPWLLLGMGAEKGKRKKSEGKSPDRTTHRGILA